MFPGETTFLDSDYAWSFTFFFFPHLIRLRHNAKKSATIQQWVRPDHRRCLPYDW